MIAKCVMEQDHLKCFISYYKKNVESTNECRLTQETLGVIFACKCVWTAFDNIPSLEDWKSSLGIFTAC